MAFCVFCFVDIKLIDGGMFGSCRSIQTIMFCQKYTQPDKFTTTIALYITKIRRKTYYQATPPFTNSLTLWQLKYRSRFTIIKKLKTNQPYINLETIKRLTSDQMIVVRSFLRSDKSNTVRVTSNGGVNVATTLIVW